ncbi:hypothetical protein C2857_001166 [Epichloe festucae Fl1]|uniref:Uncharacterized protein n=1 Tax=Epichloe festucae (strain Fl1) TaxID=877507 RepID=A0A7S9PS20_EPIFF|nr:hypothetical protein C2857_001166 [Epichloe festucae Fl1]
MVALAHRISFISHAEERGTTQLSQHRATAHLRTCFYRHMGEAIRALNHHLVDINLPGVVWGLRKIANIVSAELYMVSTSWRHHVEGFLALVKHGGGIGKILDHYPPIRTAMYYMIIIANVANTTSPCHDLGVGSIYPGKEATRHLYSTTLYPSFPCATSLFMDMMRITELRDPRHVPPRDVRPSIVEVFTSIDEFVPDAWAEAYEIPKTAEINMIARMFKASVALYGVLALGKFQESWIDAAHYFPSLTNASGKMSHGPLRRALSGHLLGVLEEAARTLSNQESLSWPLTVLGVGIADGSAQDKEFVKKALLGVMMDPNADAGPMDSRGRLLEFWDAGGTQWDECFDRPTLVLA